METEIKWEDKMEVALGKAESASRPVLLDFFNPN